MIVSYGKPIDKGVTRLMYVGDDLQSRDSRLVWPFLIALGVIAYLAVAFPKR